MCTVACKLIGIILTRCDDNSLKSLWFGWVDVHLINVHLFEKMIMPLTKKISHAAA